MGPMADKEEAGTRWPLWWEREDVAEALFQLAAKALDVQRDAARAVDAKLVAVAAGAAIAAGLFFQAAAQASLSSSVHLAIGAAGAALLVLAILASFLGLLPQDWESVPSLGKLQELTEEGFDDGQVRGWLGDAMAQAFRANQPRLRRKVQLLRAALALVVGGVALTAASLLAGLW